MKALLLIAQTGFQDLELKGVRDALEAAGFTVELASIAAGPCTGKFGSTERAQYGLEEIDLGSFDRVAFIGGPGAALMADDARAQHLARSVVRSGKPLGAICIAPTILAKGGVLRGKKATVWDPSTRSGQAPSTRSRQVPAPGDPIDLLERSGAEFIDAPVVTDGLIVTANGPDAAEEFGRVFAGLRVMNA